MKFKYKTKVKCSIFNDYCNSSSLSTGNLRNQHILCMMNRNIQGQVEWGSEQPDLVEDVPAHCRGVGLHDL